MGKVVMCVHYRVAGLQYCRAKSGRAVKRLRGKAGIKCHTVNNCPGYQQEPEGGSEDEVV